MNEGGEIDLGMWSFGEFPLHNPLFASRALPEGLLVRLSADGANVLFASYTDPLFPLAFPGGPVAGKAGYLAVDNLAGHTGVVQYSIQPPSDWWTDGAANAFRGVSGTSAPGANWSTLLIRLYSPAAAVIG